MSKKLKLLQTFDGCEQLLALEALGIRRVAPEDFDPSDPVNDPQYTWINEPYLFSNLDWEYSKKNYQRTLEMKTNQEDAERYGIAMEKFYNGEAPYNRFPSPMIATCPNRNIDVLIEAYRRFQGAMDKKFDGVIGYYRICYHNPHAINPNGWVGKRPNREEDIQRCLWEYERYQKEHPGEKISTPKWLANFDVTILPETFNDRLKNKKVKTYLKALEVPNVDATRNGEPILTDAHAAVLDQLDKDGGSKPYVKEIANAVLNKGFGLGNTTAAALSTLKNSFNGLSTDAQRTKLVEKFVAAAGKTTVIGEPRLATTPEQKIVSALTIIQKLFKTYDEDTIAKIVFGGGESGTALDSIEEQWNKVLSSMKRVSKLGK